MNSRYYYNDDFNPCKKRPERKEKEKEKCPTIVKCGSIGAVSIPAATEAGTTFTASSLSLNIGKICNPCVKLEFTSNLVTADFTGIVSFQVYKQCRHQVTPVPIGPSFIFDRDAATTGADTFTFFICDCDSCHDDCCNYTVVATVTETTAGTLNINNATLAATATCQGHHCC